VSIYPFNDEFYAISEYPFIHKINAETLETISKTDLKKKFGILYHTSHPHVMPDGTVYNLGLSLSNLQPVYNIICYPKGERVFEDAKIVAEIPVRWKFHPAYMHTFGITESFFVIVEHPLTLSVKSIMKSKIRNKPLYPCIKFLTDETTKIHLVDRKTGKLSQSFQTGTFFFFHIINQFEEEDHVVIDICCFKDPNMMDSMYIESMENENSDVFQTMFKSKPLRFILPLGHAEKIRGKSKSCKRENLVKLQNSTATAFSLDDGSIFCKPELLCDIGCELPRINYSKFLGCDYQFFYANSPVNDGLALIKVDVKNKTELMWSEPNCFASEPIFIESPEATSEDDGVLVASILQRDDENQIGLLLLDAKTMKEVGRCEFKDLPGPVPKCFHGWFAENV
jgi:carotenoid isomerooxygenase